MHISKTTGKPCYDNRRGGVWYILCGSKHPEFPELRCRYEAGHRGRHAAEDWHSLVKPAAVKFTARGAYQRMGVWSSWDRLASNRRKDT